MSTYHNSTASRNDWHLVYIRLDENNLPLRLAIRIESIEINVDVANWFFIDLQLNAVDTRRSNTTTSRIVRELGWSDDVANFTQICANQRVPAGLQQGDVFQLWISGLLLNLATNNQNSWILNDGCS
ncbi:hypothetical protein HBI70_083190 [Parastagonospora nodorum]|nr:hypothetical protein HBH52_082420 [Parastagonospora nodorum]KAH4050625.1 hypothetical protein HBH49_121100 [Parastagonospora nodorum]KAH4402157.1 hypothetical protein HBH92_215290 [Parastagonospora nodorum]KAH4434526.1 hypothetical protein HBH93_120590 [Parastagonospora nodorum]KAH4446545.1 hypothetical protein HBH91_146990 [Parastagonospora nodorum]